MGIFTVVPQDAFNDLQVDAGVLLNTFDPSNPAAPADADIICATTGGINVVCTPTFSDYGEDVDNVAQRAHSVLELGGYYGGGVNHAVLA